MSLSFKKLKHRFIKSDLLIFTFIRSIVSSQAASWADMAIGFVLFSVVGLSTFISTAIGAISGGILNCLINYKFTFHAKNCSWRAVSVKYTFVWIGSVLLNSLGTDFLYQVLKMWNWLEQIGFTNDGFYAVARLSTSLFVSLAWNFVLQRNFVYRNTHFDKYAIKATYALWPDKDHGLGAFRIWKPIGIVSSLAAVVLAIVIIIQNPTHHAIEAHKNTITELQQTISNQENQIASMQATIDSLIRITSTPDSLTNITVPDSSNVEITRPETQNQ